MATKKTTGTEKSGTTKKSEVKKTGTASKSRSTKKSSDSILKVSASKKTGNVKVGLDAENIIKNVVNRNWTRGKKTGVLSIVIIIVALLLFGTWFVYGKPTIEIGAEGWTVVQTEEPIIEHIGEIFRGEYPPKTEYVENNNGTGEKQSSVKKSNGQVTSSSGTKGSFPGDLGNAENSPLYLGNPTDAVSDVSKNTNYLMVKPQYTLSYNTETLCPNWVAWHLDNSDFGGADRSNDFRPDEDLPAHWYAVKKADYQYNAYGYDRGHVCPSADRTKTPEDNSMTFLMTNMVPQSPDNNRVIWMHFEAYERELVKDGKEAYIIAGPYGTGGTGAKGTFDSIPINLKSGETLNMNVPAYTWKVVIVLDEGSDDLNRINKNSTVIAINVPNQMGMGKTGDWEQYITTIDEIEALTGYDFFELLPDDIEDALEASVYQK